jgi:tetratricopeptide (TPR) repeat protein
MRIAIALLLLTLACGTSEDELATHLQEAESYEAQDDLGAALIELKLALALSPLDAQINFRIGQVLEAQRQLGEAIYYYSEASRLDPGHVDALLAEAALVRHVDLDQAEGRLTQAVEIDPSNTVALLRLAHVQRQADKLELALASAEEGLALEPENARLHCARAAIHAAHAKREQAPAGTDDPDAPHPKLTDALDDVNRCAELSEPEDLWGAELTRARILEFWPGREQQATEAYVAALEASAAAEGDGAGLQVGRSALRFAREQGDAALTRRALEQLLAGHPQQLAAWTELALLETREGGDPAAIHRRMLEAMHGDTRAHVFFAQYLRRTGRSDEALAHLTELTRADAEDAEGPTPEAALSALVTFQIESGLVDPEAGRSCRRPSRVRRSTDCWQAPTSARDSFPRRGAPRTGPSRSTRGVLPPVQCARGY